MMLVKHTCKFCGEAVELAFDDEPAIFTLDKWKDMAACNSCSDFLERRRVIYTALRNLYYQWLMSQQSEKKKNVSEQLSLAMEKLIRNWLSRMNEFFKTDIAWDSQVMEHLLKGTMTPTAVLFWCERMMRREAGNPALRIGRVQFPQP